MNYPSLGFRGKENPNHLRTSAKVKGRLIVTTICNHCYRGKELSLAPRGEVMEAPCTKIALART
jgi:hypothetical protein